jgi:cell division protein FtsQ
VWHNPRQLNLAAGTLTGVAVAVFALALLTVLLRTPLLPVREVVVHGNPQHVGREAIEAALLEREGGNFFAFDLVGLRLALERLPWVRRVELRRVWPDRVEVAFEEHVALAHWGDDALVNTLGERFDGEVDEPLPRLAGPAGTEREVAERYRRFAPLLEPLGAELERVVLSPRFSWQLGLANGLLIVLGRDSAADPIEARLARFVGAFPETLGRLARRHEYVDLRYPNGFALRVPELARAATAPAKGKK